MAPIRKSKLYRNPAHSRGVRGEFATAKYLARYCCRGWFEMNELDPEAVEPVKQAIKEWQAELEAHHAKYGD